MSKPVELKNLNYLRERDNKMVRGIFKNFETRGGELSFVFRKYQGDPIKKYKLVDGQVYTIPLGVAKHLNSNCSYPIHHYASDENGLPVMQIQKNVSRFGFQSLEFMDIEDLNPNPQKEIVIATPL